jgi:hypothetical protein
MFQLFSEMLVSSTIFRQIFFRDVGLVNYFLSIFYRNVGTTLFVCEQAVGRPDRWRTGVHTRSWGATTATVPPRWRGRLRAAAGSRRGAPADRARWRDLPHGRRRTGVGGGGVRRLGLAIVGLRGLRRGLLLS